RARQGRARPRDRLARPGARELATGCSSRSPRGAAGWPLGRTGRVADRRPAAGARPRKKGGAHPGAAGQNAGAVQRLLRTQRRRYAGLAVMVLGLQLAATVASLWLPTLNADIIGFAIARGDTAYIWQVGSLRLAARAVQAVAQI